MRLLQSRGQLNLAAKAFDIEPGTKLGQDFYDNVATERDFADDEDACHSTAQVVGDLVAVAERALKTLGQIAHRFLIQRIIDYRRAPAAAGCSVSSRSPISFSNPRSAFPGS